MKTPRYDFNALVAEALDGLPEWVRAHIDNLAVVVEPSASDEQRRTVGVSLGSELLGLYEGVPLTQRGRGYQLVPPDRITLFREPLEWLARDPRGQIDAQQLVTLIRRTVIHEIAHHFGLSEAQLDELGY